MTTDSIGGIHDMTVLIIHLQRGWQGALLLTGLAFAPFALLQGQLTQPAPAGLLRTGSVLRYTSGGVETPWLINSITREPMGGMRNCVQIKLQIPMSAAPTTRLFCVDSMLVWTFQDSLPHPRASRPIRAGGSMESRAANGNVTRYEAGDAVVELIDGVSITVIPTVVTTRDSTGRVLRRLRERFAIGLMTATGGVFEVPDSTRDGGWRTERSFELTSIVTPRAAERNTMLRWHPAVGFHMGGPSRVALAIGGYRVTKGGDTNAGYTVLVEPGLDAMSVRGGRTRIGPFFSGYSLELSALRTWDRRVGSTANSTYAGVAGRLMFLGFNLGVTAFVPLSRRDGQTPFVSGTGGFGF